MERDYGKEEGGEEEKEERGNGGADEASEEEMLQGRGVREAEKKSRSVENHDVEYGHGGASKRRHWFRDGSSFLHFRP